MGNFDDANVDKDLLSQIFADGGDSLDDNLLEDEADLTDTLDLDGSAADGMFAGEDAAKQSGEAEAKPKKKAAKKTKKAEEETGLNEDTEVKITLPKEPPVLDTPAPEAEVPAGGSGGQPEKEPEEPKHSVRAGVPQDDVVCEEARRVLDEERKTGTVTLITENTKITGSISSDGSLEVIGEITGDIECQGKVYVNGIVSGSVIASEIYVNTPRLVGGLQSESVVKVGGGTVIIGDVVGNEAYIAGAVKGNIDINGSIVIDSTAVIQGDIRAKSIQINNGAVVDGYCSMNYANVDVDDVFASQQ